VRSHYASCDVTGGTSVQGTSGSLQETMLSCYLRAAFFVYQPHASVSGYQAQPQWPNESSSMRSTCFSVVQPSCDRPSLRPRGPAYDVTGLSRQPLKCQFVRGKRARTSVDSCERCSKGRVWRRAFSHNWLLASDPYQASFSPSFSTCTLYVLLHQSFLGYLSGRHP
jgi:hypothetical protein